MDQRLLPAWGPSEDELEHAKRFLNADLLQGESEPDEFLNVGMLQDSEADEGFSSGEEDFDENELDIGLIERMEVLYVNDVVDTLFNEVE